MKIFKVYTIILLFSLPIAVLCKDEKVAEEKEGNWDERCPSVFITDAERQYMLNTIEQTYGFKVKWRCDLEKTAENYAAQCKGLEFSDFLEKRFKGHFGSKDQHEECIRLFSPGAFTAQDVIDETVANQWMDDQSACRKTTGKQNIFTRFINWLKRLLFGATKEEKEFKPLQYMGCGLSNCPGDKDNETRMQAVCHFTNYDMRYDFASNATEAKKEPSFFEKIF